MTKAELRREMRTRLAALSGAHREKSRALVTALMKHSGIGGTGWIAIFSPIPSEPDIELLWDALPGRFCYPRVAEGKMEFVEVEKVEQLGPSGWHPHIREHTLATARVVPPVEIGVILVPGLAFTRKGLRLGRGGGYYDRYLATLPPTALKIGVCFALQLVDAMPTEPHDQRMNAVVTEEGLAS